MSEKEKKGIDYRFLTGLIMLIFLVLMHSFVKEIPTALVVIPALVMGVDLKAILQIIKEYRK